MKLDDPGANLVVQQPRPLDGKPHETAKLTFDAGVGDAPDDWYILYRDPESHLLKAMAYIVTYGKSVEEANKEPHAITYHDFEEVEGVKIPMTWKFWLWSEEKGVHGDQLGAVRLSTVKFVTPSATAFSRPDDAKANTLP